MASAPDHATLPMQPELTRLAARYVLTPAGILPDASVAIGPDGRIAAIEPSVHPSALHLGEVVLAPGLVNAHSHAFQRIIRGRTEFLAAGRLEESFWTWRALMYRAANALDTAAVAAISALAFCEMVRAGITSVGEFHYLHGGDPDPLGVDAAVIDAARGVGLRIALLRVAYARAGARLAALPEQRRFIEPDPRTFLDRAAALAARYAHDPAVSVGLAPHSVRAVSREWLEAIAAEAGDRPVHVHACEQRRELEECRAEHGMGPIELLAEVGLLGPRTTVVHATHLDARAHALLAERGATVCACPTTERNLGDGFLPATRLVEDGVPICLGSDSQAQIDLFAEARLVEYHERLRAERRNVLARFAQPRADGDLATADVLWPMATIHGARSLGIPAGALEVGAFADLISVDLDDLTLFGARPERMHAHLVFDAHPRAVRDVFVGGRPVMRAGVIAGEAEVRARARAALAAFG